MFKRLLGLSLLFGMAATAPKPRADEVERLSADLARERERAEALLRDNAERVVRREIRELRKKAPKLASNKDKWRVAVTEFYERHGDFVASAMQIDESEARAYCKGQASALLAGGLAVVGGWESEAPDRLVALALGGGE